MRTFKTAHIVCDDVICRGEYIGHVDIMGSVKIPGECKNYHNFGEPDNWFIEMHVTNSDNPKIELGYTYIKQREDGLARATITFRVFEAVDVENKSIWIIDENDADRIMELLCGNMDDEIGEMVDGIQTFTNNDGDIMIYHKETK